MDPRSNNTSGIGLPQSGSDMGQLPPIHTPASFHPPETEASRFDAALPAIDAPAVPSQPAVPTVAPPLSAAPQADSASAASAAISVVTDDKSAPSPLDAIVNTPTPAAPADDTDTLFDEEWVSKAQEAIERTHADPYLQSKELGKIKAQYIKLRYNKDIKVEE